MRWVRCERKGKISYGIVEDDTVAEVDGSPFNQYKRNGTTYKLSEARLLVPVVPPTFYCVAYNYIDHAAEANTFLKAPPKVPTRPEPGYRTNNALIADGEKIVIPIGSSGAVQYEGELVAVIGKIAKHVKESEALSYVLGYTIGNDISERTWQKSDRSIWRSKNADTFKPMGPWIETDVDLPSLMTRVRLNGKPVSEFQTNRMIFGVAAYISEITKFVTMHPGDVIWMGTDAPCLDMHDGDEVEVEIDGIGVLRNPVVAEGKA